MMVCGVERVVKHRASRGRRGTPASAGGGIAGPHLCHRVGFGKLLCNYAWPKRRRV